MKKILCTAVLLMISCGATAETRWVWGVKVWEASMDTSRFGQCFIRLYPSVDLPSILPACKAEYIIFDCAAEFEGSSKTSNNRKFEMALVAQLTQQKTSFLVNDQKTNGGYCFAEQVRLLR